MGGKDRANIRELILDCLMEVMEEGTYSHIILNDVLNKYAYLPKKDRSFLTIVFEGTLERRITLDYILNTYSKTPVEKMKPLIRNLLRSALYQILYLDGVYDSEVVNESVKLSGKRGFKGLSGFVNGLLRNISRNKENLPMPDEKEEPVRYLSVKYSTPEWIIEKWLKKYDRNTVEGILSSSLERAKTTIRINKNTDLKALMDAMAGAGIQLEGTSLKNAYTLKGYDRLTEVPGFVEGKFQIQDISSIRVGNLIGEYIDLQDKNVIDVCAAPGGKSLHLWDMGSYVTACDLSDRKIGLIRENFEKAGTELTDMGRVRLLVRDATHKYPEFEEKFDVVLADVPCSGLGVLSRKADIKYRLSKEELSSIAELQSSILKNVMAYCKSGGILAFSTCTINSDENEAHRDMILETGSFRLLFEEQRLPGRDPGDGFYIALFRKE